MNIAIAIGCLQITALHGKDYLIHITSTHSVPVVNSKRIWIQSDSWKC